MKAARAVLFAIIATTGAAFAQPFEYVVPVLGSVTGVDGEHFAYAWIFNPGRDTATVEFSGVYPANPGKQCAITTPKMLAPMKWIELGPSSCTGVYALSVRSDHPLYLRNIVYSVVRNVPGVYAYQAQRVPMPAPWLAAGTSALITSVVAGEFLRAHANLLIVNPNPVPLNVTVKVERPESYASRTDRFEVAPGSMVIRPVEALPDPVFQGMPIIVTGSHVLTVNADGRYYAAASFWVDRMPTYVDPIALEP